VVECGSGVSTLWLALAIEHYGLDTRVVSLEDDLDYARSTEEMLRAHGVDARVEVRHAPLRDASLGDHDVPWYDTSTIADLHDIGLLFVDGPPVGMGKLAPCAAVSLLHDRLAQRSSVLLNDLGRDDEQEAVEPWSTLLPGYTRTDLALEKVAVLLRRV
jgi:hypothetical protein